MVAANASAAGWRDVWGYSCISSTDYEVFDDDDDIKDSHSNYHHRFWRYAPILRVVV